MKYSIVILLMLLTAGCQNKPDNKSTSPAQPQKDLIELNRSYINEDREKITDFIHRSSLRFEETGTGLWYTIVDKGTGEQIMTGDKVTYSFECSLIDGTPCYSGSKTLRVGYEGAESGVTEGLKLMRQGSECVFIIPPYLAYGITGDGNRIPGRSILVYRIRIREIS